MAKNIMNRVSRAVELAENEVPFADWWLDYYRENLPFEFWLRQGGRQ